MKMYMMYTLSELIIKITLTCSYYGYLTVCIIDLLFISTIQRSGNNMSTSESLIVIDLC